MKEDDHLRRWFVTEILPLERKLERFIARHRRERVEVADVRQDVYTRLIAVGAPDRTQSARAYLFAVAAALGADDMAVTAGGQPYGNVGKVYANSTLSPAEAAALNRTIQRVSASPQTLAYLTRWHGATGRLSAPLVTMHNTIDSLVPYTQETEFKATVAKAGRSARLVEYPVSPLRAPLPVGGVAAYTHCGLTSAQTEAAWAALRGWVTTGIRPSAAAVR